MQPTWSQLSGRASGHCTPGRRIRHLYLKGWRGGDPWPAVDAVEVSVSVTVNDPASGPPSSLTEDCFAAAVRLVQRQQFAEALPLLVDVVASDPRHGKAHGCLGVCYGATERYDLALKHLAEGERLLGPNSSLSYNRGLALQEQGHQEEARRAFVAAVSLDSGNRAAAKALAQLDGAPVPPPPSHVPLLLECVNDPRSSRPILLTGSTSIGRGWRCDIRVKERGVAATHAVLTRNGEELWCYPGPGVAEVWVDDSPVRSARLQEGSELRVGTRIYRVRCADEQSIASTVAKPRASSQFTLCGVLLGVLVALLAGGYWAHRKGWITIPILTATKSAPAPPVEDEVKMPTVRVPGRGEMSYLAVVRAYLQRYDQVGLSPGDTEIVSAYSGDPVNDNTIYLRRIRARRKGLNTDDDRLDRAYVFVLMSLRHRAESDTWARVLRDTITIEASAGNSEGIQVAP